ncbi:hypothetical protein GBF38_004258 [Nibea albiflora]|uniref:Uncharacterized protein n=1 Tax=Nibea albiflora TaxID=240163 RepID=A0ACB7FCZ6_NIBAL|nr:hypothetical protein GBF38_004258 [Nibea albiflora]
MFYVSQKKESEKPVRRQCTIRSLEEALKREKKAKAFLEEALDKEEKAYDALKEDLKKERKENDFLEDALDKEEKACDSLIEDLKNERKARDLLEEALENEEKSKAELQDALKQEQKQKHSLEKSLKEVQDELDLMKTKVARLKKSHQEETARLEGTITEIKDVLVSNQKLTADLKKDLEVSVQQKKEMAEREMANCAEIKALQERLMKQKKESLEKDEDIKSLHFKIQTNFEAKDIVSSLQEKVKQQAADLKEESEKNCALKRDYEAAVSQQRKDQDKLDHLIQDNQDLVSQKKMLQDKFDAALKKLDQKQLQEGREDRHCSRLEEVCFSESSENTQKQKEELSLKTVALEKSLMAEKHLKSSLKKEKKHYEKMLQRQESAATFVKDQLKEASAKSESLMYDLQTLKMDNADIRAKFNALEKANDELISQHSSLVKCHEEIISKKNQTISEGHRTITELECMVNRLRAQQAENKTRQATAEVALKYETTKNIELQQKVDQISSCLDEERATCEKYRVELKESLRRQIEILEQNQIRQYRQPMFSPPPYTAMPF